MLALIVGVLDGIDGKLARLKAQTTKAGKREHDLDYLVETSWWAALAYHFHATGQIRYAYLIFLAFFACDRLERMAKQVLWFCTRHCRRAVVWQQSLHNTPPFLLFNAEMIRLLSGL